MNRLLDSICTAAFVVGFLLLYIVIKGVEFQDLTHVLR